MKLYLKHLLLFLFINFGGLALGAYLQGNIIENVWYAELNTAGWTPPSWAFGFAWVQIMLFYSIYLVILVHRESFKEIAVLFIISWILNVSWNPVFFRFHQVGIALFILVALAICIVTLFVKYFKELRKKSMLLMPYLLWLIIATSLNAYVLLKN